MSELARLVDNPLVLRLSLALVHFLWQALFLVFVGVVVLAALRRARPAARYAALLVLLAAMAMAPVATFLLLTYGPPWPLGAAPTVTERTVVVVKGQVYQGLVRLSPEVAPLPVAAGAEARSSAGPLSSAWVKAHLAWAAIAWLIGVMLLSLRLLAGWLWADRTTRRGAGPVGERWQTALASLSARLRVSRPVRLLASAAAEVPATFGWLRPVILLPASAVSGLTAEQVEALIAHELAHIRRHDYLLNVFQTAVETLLFYHPAVWWVSHRIREEREQCCDDLAAEACGDAVSYARALADMEELRAGAPGLAVAAGGGSLLGRVRRLVGVPMPHSRRCSPWLAGALATVVALALATSIQITSTASAAESGAGGGYIAGEILDVYPSLGVFFRVQKINHLLEPLLCFLS